MKNEDLLQAIGDARDEWVEQARAPRVRRRSLSLPAAVLTITLALSLCALAAADSGVFYDALYALSPSMAQALRPVQMSCVDNGIELSVISADVEGDTARVFIGLRDLEEDRIDGTCDLYDSYHIDLPGDSFIGHCSFSHFDPETKTALFLVEISRGDGKPIQESKLSFSLSQFLSGKREWKGILDLDRTLIQQAPHTTAEFVKRGMSCSDEAYDITEVMIPGEAVLQPVEGVNVTAMGWVDGMLRIQLHYERIIETDNHGYVMLEDAEGRPIFSSCSVSFWDSERSGSYEEYLFRITPEELDSLTFKGEMSSAEQLHKGSWEITFGLE